MQHIDYLIACWRSSKELEILGIFEVIKSTSDGV